MAVLNTNPFKNVSDAFAAANDNAKILPGSGPNPGIGINPGGTQAENAAIYSGTPPAAPAGTGGSLPDYGQTDTQAQTPFGQWFKPDAYGNLWQDPASVITSYFLQNRIPTESGNYAMLQDQANTLPILFLALQGAQAMGNTQENPNQSYLDWAGKYIQNLNTAGGQGVSPQAVLSALFDPNNPVLSQYFHNAQMQPSDQVNQMLSAMRYGLQNTMPTPMLSAMLSRVQTLGDQFNAIRAHQDHGYTFADYLNQQGVNPALFGGQSVPLPSQGGQYAGVPSKTD